jgi:glycosyltransferase involved in cell wall biosynthesis
VTPPLVVHLLESRVFGGTERIALNLLRRLRGAWRPVLLHSPEAPGDLRQAALNDGIELIEAPRPGRALASFARCCAVVRRLRPAVFHAQRPWPIESEAWLAAARLCGVPAVVTTEQLFPARLPRGGVLRERMLDPLLHVRIAVSEHVARRVRETFGTPPHRVAVVLNGIEPAPYEASADPALRQALCPAGQPLVLTVAHLRAQKGLDVLVRAAADVPHAVFAIVGEGPDREALERAIAAAGLGERVILLGSRQDVPRLLASCDIFVLPSRYEGLPLAVLEAMAAGRAVVATAIGGTSEAITDGDHGLLVPPDDAVALGAAIARLLGDPEGAQRMARRARARLLERFTAARMSAEVSTIYERLLARADRRDV